MDWLSDNFAIITIPLVAAVIGWGTNVLAVEMMFYPLRFLGIWKIGWQGIIPRNSVELAGKSTDLITSKLLNLRTIFDSFDAKTFADSHLASEIDRITDQVLAETAERHGAQMWAMANDAVKAQIRAMVRADVEKLTKTILHDVGSNIENILDVKEIVLNTVRKDRALIGRMFLTTGKPEFKFIKDSGAYFGLLFGLMQMAAWIIYPKGWVLPAAGFLVGYATNWLALWLIFEPKQPRKVGPFTVHGLFHKRQREVSQAFSDMLSREVLNTEAMVQHMAHGPGAEKLFAIVEKHVSEMLDRYRTNPMAAALMPADKVGEIKAELFSRLREELPRPNGFLHVFTSKAIDIYNELFERMTKLDSESFEGVLRPAFQKDEWKLIVVGAVLGLAAGFGQLYFMF